MKIRASTNVFVPADKTRNIYEMNPAAYSKLLTENVTNIYKHAEEGTVNAINDDLMQLASKLDISGRVDRTSENPAFITLKDHKPNFENHPKCRLINPSKSSLGKVSKVILDRINNDICDQVHVNQWRNSTDVISWFINIKDKSRKSFISYDIVDFYPSISESLLDQAIEWAKQHSEISDQNIQVIKHARKSLLHHDGTAWRKRNSDSTFDVTMGSYDGAEVCELIGLFVLDTLKDRFGYDIGLYRDDGLATLNTRSGRLNDKARKDLEHIFNDFGLNITVLTNQLQTNFLDLTLDLANNTYKPYRKPNDTPFYINRLSNHPPSILKQIPSSMQQRINSLSHNQQAFDTAAPIYNDALKRSNFHAEINYEPSANTNSINKRRTRQRNTFGITHHFVRTLRQTLHEISYCSSTNIFHRTTDYTLYSTDIPSVLAIVVAITWNLSYLSTTNTC